MKKFLLLLVVSILAVGCSSNTSKIITANDDFYIVQPGSKDNYTTLAEQYLGDGNLASVIARYNPEIGAVRSSQIAIPKITKNPAGVFFNGYQQVPILCYHQFTVDENGRSKMVISRREFEEQMAYLKNNDYQVVTLKQVSEFMREGKELPVRAVAITIDDGYRSYYTVAYPILKKYGFPSTIFVYPDFVGAGLALNWKQVKMLDEDPLVEVESHSKSHDSLSPKPGGEDPSSYMLRLKNEVETTDRIFNRRVGKTSQYFAYPYGNSSKQLVELLDENNYALAMTVKKGANPSFAFPYLLNRTMIYGRDSLATFKRSLQVFQETNLK